MEMKPNPNPSEMLASQKVAVTTTKSAAKGRKSSKRATSSDATEDVSPAKSKRNSVSSTVELLQKIFPKVKATSLEETLHACDNDVLKAIEQLIKEARDCDSNSNSDSESAAKGTSTAELALKLPDADFNEIRKQFGFSKKKPKNSFVRHKANYENALREQAKTVVTGIPSLDQARPSQVCFDALGQVEPLANSFGLKGVPQPMPGPPCAPQQLLSSMFGNTNHATSPPSGASNGPMHRFALNEHQTPSPVSSSPTNLLSSCPPSIASMSPMTTGLGSINSQQRSFLNTRALMLNPLMHGPAASMLNSKMEPDSKPPGHHGFLPNNNLAPTLPHLSRNFFDSLVASTGYRSLFPAFFPGAAPNLAALGLLGTGLSGAMAMQTTLNSEQPVSNLLPNGSQPLGNFEQNFEELNQKLLSQRNHQLQTALHNMCDNGWYGDLARNNSNGSSQSKCDDKVDTLS